MDSKKGNMTEKIFIDSSAELFELGYLNKIKLFTTAVVLANVFYMLRKTSGIEKAKKEFTKITINNTCYAKTGMKNPGASSKQACLPVSSFYKVWIV
jgi:hypothetical protein